jgi:hypothetical protein
MFCRLFELKSETGIDLISKKEHCSSDCEYFNKGCEITKDTDIPLERGKKYGWTIDEKIKLLKPAKSSQFKIFFDKMIQIIHPTADDIWIFRCFREDLETVVYMVFLGGKRKESLFKTLEEVNRLIQNKANYNGRDIVEEDFN